MNHLPHHLFVPGTAGGPVGRAGSDFMRRSVASVLLVCLIFEGVKVSASVRGRKEEKIAYVVRWEPELENVINPKRKKEMVDQLSCLR
jgi:hypothetical protein